jgi:hypothetical protein
MFSISYFHSIHLGFQTNLQVKLTGVRSDVVVALSLVPPFQSSAERSVIQPFSVCIVLMRRNIVLGPFQIFTLLPEITVYHYIVTNLLLM